MTTTDYTKFAIIDSCSGNMITGEEALSLFMKDDGENKKKDQFVIKKDQYT